MAEIPILLLAAGSSSRMGQPKQLLPWGNRTLIEHQIQTLVKTDNPVNVVIGSNSELIIPVIEKYPVSIFINPDWECGMGSSISFAISRTKQKFPNAKGVLIALLDQPLITTAFIEKILGAYQPGAKQILVSQSASGWTGVPVLFDECYFKELSELRDDEGAKKIIKSYPENVISFEGGDMLEDVDTPETYQQLLNKQIKSTARVGKN